MEKGRLTEEQFETLQKVAEICSGIVKAFVEKLKELASKLVVVFKRHGTLLIKKMNLDEMDWKTEKQTFNFVSNLKVKHFKSQVQLNKPKFIQARSRL